MNPNKTHKILCLVMAGIFFCTALSAQEADPAEPAEMLETAELSNEAEASAVVRLTPDEAVQQAIRNNLGLESSRVNLGTRHRASSLSWNQFIPSITAAGIINRNNEASTASGFIPIDMATVMDPLLGGVSQIPGVPPMSFPSWQIYGVYPYSVDLPRSNVLGSLQVQMNINVAMFENMRRLRLDYEAGNLGYEKVRAQLERDVRKAYHNMLLIQENIDLLKGSFDNAQRQVEIAQANFNAGLAPELLLLQAQVARENLRPIIDQAENGLKLSMAQFSMFLGLEYDTEFELIPVSTNIEFIPLDVVELIKEASQKKPDIQELRQTIMMMHSGRKAQVYALLPNLGLSYNYNPVFTGDPWNDKWFGGDKDWTDRGSFSITLGMRLHSLIPFSPDFQGIRNMDDQIEAANLGLAQMIYGTEIEIYNIVLTLERIRITAEAMLQTINLAEQSYRLTEQAYRAGLQDYFQVQSAEQSLHQAQVQMLEQQFNYLNGLIDLEYSIGVPFGTLSRRD